MMRASSNDQHAAPPSPARLLWTTALAIYFAEAAIMVAFGFLPQLPALAEALLDATLLVTITLPILYLTWARILRRSIDEHARARAALDARALRDPLTQLPNRLAFETSTERELEQARKTLAPFTLVLLDVRRFHEINRALGHKLSDTLLCQIAERLRNDLPHSEFVTRLGPDLFGVLLQGVPLARASEASARVHQVIETPFVVAGNPLEIEGHCGVAVFPDHGDNASILLQRAEAALRRAKEQGVGSQTYQPEDETLAQRRVKLFGMLRAAISGDELVLSYQPKVEFGTGRVVGAEALLGWRHPELGAISPAEFIPLAEQTSLIKPLTAWVITEAIKQIANWKSQGLVTRISVNLSARNLADESLPGFVAEQLAKYDVAPDCLVAEITESAVLADPERAGDILEQLSEMGVALSLDDFGTGYSSLTYLRTLPARELKIDRSFVVDVDRNESNASIIGAIIKLAHDLDLKVVAEGVETPAVYQRVRQLGCDIVQGYLISRPLPAPAFAAFLRQYVAGYSAPDLAIIPGLNLPQIALVPLASVRPALRESLRSLRAAGSNALRSDAPS
jgi:diguanylate cyclase (GGDEF)-like protein